MPYEKITATCRCRVCGIEFEATAWAASSLPLYCSLIHREVAQRRRRRDRERLTSRTERGSRFDPPLTLDTATVRTAAALLTPLAPLPPSHSDILRDMGYAPSGAPTLPQTLPPAEKESK